MFRKLIPAIAVTFAMLATRSAHAADHEFDYKDPKEISAVALTIDSKLEPIFGFAKGVSGKVNFDPNNPKATTGKIAVDVGTIVFANDGYTQTARNYALEQDKFPKIYFTLKKVIGGTKPSPNVFQGTVLADFTCHGVTIPMTVPVTATYFPGRALERTNGKYKGDLLVIRTNFSVSRTKLGITAGIPIDLVSDTIDLRVSCVGISYAPGQIKPEDEKKREDLKGKKSSSPAKTPQRSNASIWKMEVEMRDNPIKADATFDLNSDPPKATFKTALGQLEADKTALVGNKLTFHLTNNPITGDAEGSAVFEGDMMTGRIKTRQGSLGIHARVKNETDDVVKVVQTPSPQSTSNGFQDLKLFEDETNWTLSERMKYHHVPAVSIARIQDFKVVETGVFGVTNIETGEAVDSNTLFQAGGMGSPLVNLLAFKLAILGRLDLNRDVNSYLKTCKIPENEFTKTRKVKVIDLINGTSGLTQYKFKGYVPTIKTPTLASLINGSDLEEMEALEVKWEPGSKFQGAGIDQAILEQVIVEATGEAFPKLMSELIFKPFEMEHSVYDPMPTSKPESKVALGHYSTGELMLDRVHFYSAVGETGLWTTAADFAKAMCQIQLMLAGKPNLILPEEKRDLIKQIITPETILGLHRGENDDSYHGGDSYGYFANHKTNLKNGTGVIVMENRIYGWKFNNELIYAIQKRNPSLKVNQ